MKASVSQHRQQGMALPTVLALSTLCSVLLMAQWRSLALAEGLGRSADNRWRLQQQALTLLLITADQLQAQGCAPKTCPPLPANLNTVSQWQSQLPLANSVTLVDSSQQVVWLEVWPAQQPLPSAQAAWVYRLTVLVSNQQGQTVGWQALWQPDAQQPNPSPPPMSLRGFKRLLALAP